jgi:CYTH domain-containing protein
VSIEQERKFLMDPKKHPLLKTMGAVGKVIEAGYFTNGPVAIRCTIRGDGVQKICFKGPPKDGAREEFEYSIPGADAAKLIKLAPTYLEKTRYYIDGWEIDHFLGPLDHLWIAEYEETPDKPKPPAPLPAWVLTEVTSDPSFSNMALAWRYGRIGKPGLQKGDSIYVSGPYTKGNVNENVQRAVTVAEKMKEFGLVPFIPHLYHLWDLISPHHYQYWMELCVDWVPKCQALFRIPGDSSGADIETELAEKAGIPIFTNYPDLYVALERRED